MSEHRIPQVNDLIRDEVAAFFRDDFELPFGTLITVTSVDTSVDLYYTTVFVSVLPKTKEQEVMNRLTRHIRDIQRHLNRRLVMKYVPQIRFKLDRTEEKQAAIDQLMQESTQHDKSKSDNQD